MLKTLFVIGFIAVPLCLAFLLILYRARYFLMGIAAIALLLMLIWGGLRIATLLEGDPHGTSAHFGEPGTKMATCLHGRSVLPWNEGTA